MSFSEGSDSTGSGSAGDLAHASSSQGYGVKLPVFEGPLDLLLHLIKQNEVDITDIPIADIAAQYLDYLEIMRSLDLDVAAEYLVMAATLAQIKSRMLLPPSEEEEEGDEIDPRAELVARLLEYQRYKEVAEALSKRRWLGRDVYPAKGMEPEPPSEAEREIEVGLFELIEAFRLVLSGAKDEEDGEGVHVVESEEVTVRDQMSWVMNVVEGRESIEFHQLFGAGGGKPNRTVLIATFLAILELTRLHALSIYQGVDTEGAPDGAIRLRATHHASEIAWSDRITELM
ncbi:MAG: segregation/condensation protein A [Myxococcota bacterium]|nr:segregation/condensation protein A [Myxococcota bacterium]